MEIFASMDGMGLRRDAITYSSLISALAKGKQWLKALQVCPLMTTSLDGTAGFGTIQWDSLGPQIATCQRLPGCCLSLAEKFEYQRHSAFQNAAGTEHQGPQLITGRTTRRWLMQLLKLGLDGADLLGHAGTRGAGGRGHLLLYDICSGAWRSMAAG